MSPDQGWDFISVILGGAFAIVLAVVLSVPIAKVVQSMRRQRQMRLHFSDTRGLRRRVDTAPKHSGNFEEDINPTQPPDRLDVSIQSRGVRALPKSQRRRHGAIKIYCPNCGHENRNTIAWARGRVKMRCANCKHEFYFRKTNVRKALDKAFDAVMEAWRRF